MTWQGALLTAAIALATAIAAGWFNKPKVRGEGKQAEGAGELSAANARIAEQVATLEQTRQAADRAEAARNRAETASDECHGELRKVRAAANAAFDVFEDLIGALPEELRVHARETLHRAREIV